MKLSAIVTADQSAHWVRALGVALLGGALASILVSIAIHGASAHARPSLARGALFLAALGVMLGSQWWSARRLVELAERAQDDLRRRVADGLLRAPLRTVEQIGPFAGHTLGELSRISAATVPLVSVVQNVAFLLCVTVLVARISSLGLVIWLVTAGMIARLLVPGLRRMRTISAQVGSEAGELERLLDGFTEGFAQLKLDERQAMPYADRLDARIESMYRAQALAEAENRLTFLRATSMFFVFGLGWSVFVPAGGLGLPADVGYELVIMLALAIAPLGVTLRCLPVLSRARSALDAVFELLDRLSTPDAASAGPRSTGGGVDTATACVDVRDLTFGYGGSSGFTVGPISLTLRPGELTLVTGGNGSGKTTLMKMLAGLYASRGSIRWNGRAVTSGLMADYRALFTLVVVDQHLFDRLYGIDVATEQVRAELTRFGLDGVVDHGPDGFTRLELSTGQRMRLAMVVALLEARPICIFDEWTANQDPETTRLYYDTLLPALLEQGRAVVAVSHDARFFDRAHQRIELADGRIVDGEGEPRR